jgi:hypothetical protein
VIRLRFLIDTKGNEESGESGLVRYEDGGGVGVG